MSILVIELANFLASSSANPVTFRKSAIDSSYSFIVLAASPKAPVTIAIPEAIPRNPNPLLNVFLSF